MEKIIKKKNYNFTKYKEIFKEISPFIFVKDKKELSRLILIIFLILLTICLNVSVPLILKKIISLLSYSTPWQQIYFLLLMYGTCWMMSQIVFPLREILAFKISERGVRLLSLKLFDHLHNLSLQFHLSRKAGAITSAIEKAQRGFPIIFWGAIFFVIPTFIEIIIVTTILWYFYGPMYGLLLIFILFLCLKFSIFVSKLGSEAHHLSNEKCSETGSYILDSLLNFETIKHLGGFRYEHHNCDMKLEEREKAQVRKNIILESARVGQAIIMGTGLIILLYITGRAMELGQIGMSDFVLINGCLLQFFYPLSFFGFIFRDIRKGMIDLEEVLNLFQVEPEMKDLPGAINLQPKQCEVVFKNVKFNYDINSPILTDISFTIPAGETVAIVGPTGSGKSTITRLLLRLYEITEGEILINGHNIKLIKRESLHTMMGIIPQEPVLFNKNIFYNISYAYPQASHEDVYEAAKISGLHDFILKLPEGYNSIVGERGLKLSGGEKQRLAIARTLLRKPILCIFDEATSFLDLRTEKFIQSNLEYISEKRTTLIIAHRLSTIINANKIIVLNNGLIEEEGTHQGLLKKRGLYFELWDSQAGVFSAECQ